MRRIFEKLEILAVSSVVICLSSIIVSCSENDQNDDSNSEMNEKLDARVDSLLALMTIQEKVGQTVLYNGAWEFTGPVPKDRNSQETVQKIKSGRIGGMLNVIGVSQIRQAQEWAVENSRLGIPMIFGHDVIHGYQTMFPVPIAQAASWDTDMAKLGSEVAAREAAAAGLNWTFAPMIDISRDARWGRIMESAGEDPYLSSEMARAWVHGFQGDDMADETTIAACAKHFAGYGLAEAGRDYNTAEINLNTLYNVVLPPFRAASDAGAATFMNAYNQTDGTPATASSFLQRDLLKKAWAFKGFVVSDWGSIAEMIVHGYSEDLQAAAKSAILAGCDMDMESYAYEAALEQLIADGEVDLSLLNDAVRRILRVKFQLGLMDDPFKYCNLDRENAELLSAKNLQASREVARKSIVLLKNEANLLPLDKNVKSIAVIGQLAASKDVPLGNWSAQAKMGTAVSLVEGVQNAVGENSRVAFAKGYTLSKGRRGFLYNLDIEEGDKSGFAEATALAARVDVVILALGEDCLQTGEGRSQANIELKGNQEELFEALLKANKNVVVILMNGRPLAIPNLIQNSPAIVETWYLGSESGHAIADVLFGDYNPTGKLPVSFPYHVGQEPLYYNRMSTGRPQEFTSDSTITVWSHYTDMPIDAVLPFGFGLSYSSFEYSDYTVAAIDQEVCLTIKITNTSQIDGVETVQVYIHDQFASLVQPVRRLVDFQKVPLLAGEHKVVTFKLTQEDLGFFHNDGSFYAESGSFKMMVGGNSIDVLEQLIDIDF